MITERISNGNAWTVKMRRTMRRCMELGRYSPHAIIIVQSPYNIESQNGVITRDTVLETIRASTVMLYQDGGHDRGRY